MAEVDNDVQGIDEARLATRRSRKGECPTCGTRLFKPSGGLLGERKMTPLTVPGQVLDGSCLICDPLDNGPAVVRKGSSRNVVQGSPPSEIPLALTVPKDAAVISSITVKRGVESTSYFDDISSLEFDNGGRGQPALLDRQKTSSSGENITSGLNGTPLPASQLPAKISNEEKGEFAEVPNAHNRLKSIKREFVDLPETLQNSHISQADDPLDANYEDAAIKPTQNAYNPRTSGTSNDCSYLSEQINRRFEDAVYNPRTSGTSNDSSYPSQLTSSRSRSGDAAYNPRTSGTSNDSSHPSQLISRRSGEYSTRPSATSRQVRRRSGGDSVEKDHIETKDRSKTPPPRHSNIQGIDRARAGNRRIRRGECPTCGTRLYKTRGGLLGGERKKTPLNIPGQVRDGMCLVCNQPENYERSDSRKSLLASLLVKGQSLIPLTLKVPKNATGISRMTLKNTFIAGHFDDISSLEFDSALLDRPGSVTSETRTTLTRGTSYEKPLHRPPIIEEECAHEPYNKEEYISAPDPLGSSPRNNEDDPDGKQEDSAVPDTFRSSPHNYEDTPHGQQEESDFPLSDDVCNPRTSVTSNDACYPSQLFRHQTEDFATNSRKSGESNDEFHLTQLNRRRSADAYNPPTNGTSNDATDPPLRNRRRSGDALNPRTSGTSNDDPSLRNRRRSGEAYNNPRASGTSNDASEPSRRRTGVSLMEEAHGEPRCRPRTPPPNIQGIDRARLVSRRIRRGECTTCGTRLYKPSGGFLGELECRKTPLTIPGKVLDGRCLICKPLVTNVRAVAQQSSLGSFLQSRQSSIPLTLHVPAQDDGTVISNITMKNVFDSGHFDDSSTVEGRGDGDRNEECASKENST